LGHGQSCGKEKLGPRLERLCQTRLQSTEIKGSPPIKSERFLWKRARLRWGAQASNGRASPHPSPLARGGQPLLAPYGVLPGHIANGDAGAYGQQWAALVYPHVQAALAAQQAGLHRPALPPGSAASGASACGVRFKGGGKNFY